MRLDERERPSCVKEAEVSSSSMQKFLVSVGDLLREDIQRWDVGRRSKPNNLVLLIGVVFLRKSKISMG